MEHCGVARLPPHLVLLGVRVQFVGKLLDFGLVPFAGDTREDRVASRIPVKRVVLVWVDHLPLPPTALAPLFLLGVLVVDDPGGVEQVAGERVRVALARLVAASEGWAEAPLLRRRVAPQEGRLRGMCQLVARRAAELWTVVRSIEKELLVVGC